MQFLIWKEGEKHNPFSLTLQCFLFFSLEMSHSLKKKKKDIHSLKFLNLLLAFSLEM